MDELELMLEWLDNLDTRQQQRLQRPAAQDGGLALVGGQLRMKRPGRGGKWPTIAAGTHECLQVLHRGQRVDKPLVVQNAEHIEFQLRSRPAAGSFSLEISSDKMEVWLRVKFVEGIEYAVADSDYVSDLVVAVRELGRQAPLPIDCASVLAELDNLGVKVKVDMGALRAACTGLRDKHVLIAKGILPIQPVDGRIEAVHDLSGRRIKHQKGKRINWFDQGKIESVKPGEVLAYWHPPQEGKAGMNVYGQRVEPRQPKWATFAAGSGVTLVENGTIAVAEIAGRPTMELGRLCVKPQLVITSDVDITTGNVDFTGDVLVAGDVRESLIIRAGGIVQIGRSAYQARILAGGSTTIGRNLIGGHVTVGGNLAAGMKLVALLRQLLPLMEKLDIISRQLKRDPRFSMQDLKLSGDGYLVKLILEKRLGAIPRLCEDMCGLLPGIKRLGEEDQAERICAILQHVALRFRGANPLEIKSVSELQSCITALQKVLAFLEDALSTPAHVSVKYSQNARIEATGDIQVTGPLVYACSMSAGQNIRIAGSCRGGHYYAASSISIKSAGLNEMAKTYLRVEEGGFVAAQVFFPGVHIKIGLGELTIREPRRNTLFCFADGRWIEKDWTWGQADFSV